MTLSQLKLKFISYKAEETSRYTLRYSEEVKGGDLKLKSTSEEILKIAAFQVRSKAWAQIAKPCLEEIYKGSSQCTLISSGKAKGADRKVVIGGASKYLLDEPSAV